MSKKKRTSRSTIESCEGILAVLKAGQRQLEYLAHEHLDFRQVLRLEENIRVGSSPERAEIQRIRLLLDARLDHVAQMRALSSLAPLTLTPMDEKRFERVSSVSTLAGPTATEAHSLPDKSKESSPKDSPESMASPVEEDQITAEESEIASAEAPKELEDSSTEELPLDLLAEAPSPEPKEAPIPVSSVEDSAPQPQEIASSTKEDHTTLQTPPSDLQDTPSIAKPIALGGIPTSSEPNKGLSLEVRPASTSNAPVVPTEPTEPVPLQESLKALMNLAAQAHSEGELERAIEAYSDLLDQVDTHLPALLARGRCLLEAKDHSAALSDFRRAQGSFPTHPAPRVALGDLFMARKEYSKAIEFFDQAIGIKPDHPQARCRRGLAHYHCGRYRQAFLDLQRAYKLDPEIPNIRRLVQMAIRKLEDSD